jgi:uncharacterized iron-regulated membrane protein
MRPLILVLHRYLGLVLAGFLLLTGLTGALLAWNDELEAWISPQLFIVSPPTLEARAQDPLILRQRVQASHADAYAAITPLHVEPGKSLIFPVYRLPNKATGQDDITLIQVFVDPYTGRLLGQRTWGEISEGMNNLMPFIYRLHSSLALGHFGSTLLGIVALLWTLDCFGGVYLSFPVWRRSTSTGGRSWLARWWPSWLVRWHGGRYKRYFDLHRASGLWPWAMLLVFAWSSVCFNLHTVYEPVMQAVLAYQPEDARETRPQKLRLSAKLDWDAARKQAHQLMSQAALSQGLRIEAESSLMHDPRYGIYRYTVRSDRDIHKDGGSTSLTFDADNGELIRLWLPTGTAAGDTFNTWMASLHMAKLWGTPYQAFICVLGLVVAVLSGTGVLIWAKKRRARLTARSGVNNA